MTTSAEPRGTWMRRGMLVCIVVALGVSQSSCIDFGRVAVGADASTVDSGSAVYAPDDAAGAEAVVYIRSFMFVPQEVHIPAGGTVRWIDEDSGTFHFVVQGEPRGAEMPAFQSPRLDPGGMYVATFPTPGTYLYYCSNHSAIMRDARVVVE